jgi:AcrR family transcriptional regulator
MAFLDDAERPDPFAERILAAARAHLIRDGLRRTSLDDVARTAGVGRATLFRRFPNRTSLMHALGLAEARRAIAAVDAAVAGIDAPDAFLIASVQAVIRQITGNEIVQRLLVTDPEIILAVASTRGGAILALGREYIAGHLRRLQRAGHPMAGRIDVTAEMLARLVLSLALNPISVLPLDDDAAVAAFVRDTVAPWLTLYTEKSLADTDVI